MEISNQNVLLFPAMERVNQLIRKQQQNPHNTKRVLGYAFAVKCVCDKCLEERCELAQLTAMVRKRKVGTLGEIMLQYDEYMGIPKTSAEKKYLLNLKENLPRI